jgi:hypothetical protein
VVENDITKTAADHRVGETIEDGVQCPPPIKEA